MNSYYGPKLDEYDFSAFTFTVLSCSPVPLNTYNICVNVVCTVQLCVALQQQVLLNIMDENKIGKTAISW